MEGASRGKKLRAALRKGRRCSLTPGRARCRSSQPGLHVPPRAAIRRQIRPGAGQWDGRVWTRSGPRAKMAFLADGAPTPILGRPNPAVPEGKGEGGSQRSRDGLALAAGGRLRINFSEDSASPLVPGPAGYPEDCTAQSGAVCSGPGGDSDLPHGSHGPKSALQFGVASVEADSGWPRRRRAGERLRPAICPRGAGRRAWLWRFHGKRSGEDRGESRCRPCGPSASARLQAASARGLGR